MQVELFEIALNSEGRRQIPRLFTRVKFIFIASIIWSAIMLLTTAGSLFTLYSRDGRYMDRYITIRLMAGCSFTLVSAILLPLQSYFYLAFSRRLRESIDEQDPSKFNSSFRLLTTNATICIISAVVSITYTLFNVLQGFLFSRLGY